MLGTCFNMLKNATSKWICLKTGKKTDQMDPNGYSNCENDDQPMDVMFFRTLDRASTVSTSK